MGGISHVELVGTSGGRREAECRHRRAVIRRIRRSSKPVAFADIGGEVLRATPGPGQLGVSGPADATAEVTVSVPGECSVIVRTGTAAVVVETGPKAFPVVVESRTGEITAWIDPGAGARVDFATSAEITSDFSVDIEYRYHEQPAKYGVVRSPVEGSGDGVPVRLTSRQGPIRLRHPETD